MTDTTKPEKRRKPRRMEPYTAAWHKAAYDLARSYVQLHPCADCGGPVNRGYCCIRCGSTNPEGHK